MDTVANALSTLALGAPVAYEALTFFPLVSPHARQPDYLTLDEALGAGHARVTEVSEGGSVPELRFVNTSDHRVLLLDGEELVGAKQNRVLNVTILVAPKQTVTIPVSCVEQGRWRYHSPEFQTAGRAQFARGRAAKAAQVSSSLREHGVRRSDQGQVWDAIQEKADRLQAHSATGSMSDIFERYTADLGSYERALPPVEGQVGALFAVAGQVSGLDLFDAGATLGKLWPKLVGSYALDAIEAGGRRPGDAPAASVEAAEGFLRAVASARADRFPALGLGEDLRLEGPGLAGGALAFDGRVVHLGAFRLDGPSGTRRPGMARASTRRAHRL